jgi:hypothetical protein
MANSRQSARYPTTGAAPLRARKTDRMTLPYSHNAAKVGNKNIVTAIDAFVFVSSVCVPVRFAASPVIFSPCNALHSAPVELIVAAVRSAKVAKAVVAGISIRMINHGRLLVMNKKPGNAMGHVPLSVVRDLDVPVRQATPGNHAGLDAFPNANAPSKFARIGIVIKDIANRVWNNLCSHAESPLSVVRGSVVGATDAPILYQIPNKMNIGGLNG